VHNDKSMPAVNEADIFQETTLQSLEDGIVNAVEPYLRANYGEEFSAILKAGVDPYFLVRSLCLFQTLEIAALEAVKTRKEILTRGIAKVTVDEIENFPKRVRKMAREIRDVNVGTIPLRAPPSEFPPLYSVLPLIMEGYAAFLNKQHASDLAEYNRAASTLRATRVLVALVGTIESKAGRPMLREVAYLIQGTEDALFGRAAQKCNPSLGVKAIAARSRRATRPEK